MTPHFLNSINVRQPLSTLKSNVPKHTVLPIPDTKFIMKHLFLLSVCENRDQNLVQFDFNFAKIFKLLRNSAVCTPPVQRWSQTPGCTSCTLLTDFAVCITSRSQTAHPVLYCRNQNKKFGWSLVDLKGK